MAIAEYTPGGGFTFGVVPHGLRAQPFVMIKGYPTIADAAKQLNVSAKTIRQWIRKGIIADPPVFLDGTREISMFPDEYLDNCREQIKAHVEMRRRKC